MTNNPARSLPGRLLSDEVAGPDGQPAILIEALPVESGQRISIVFESVGRDYPQGVFIATEGLLDCMGTTSRAFEFLENTAPAEIPVEIVETDGALVFYNIWNEGVAAGFESQAYTSGMVREELGDGSVRYACRDYGFGPEFDSVVFRLTLASSSGS